VTGRAAGLAAAPLLALTGVAQANKIRFGSDLKAPANLAEAHPVDSAFWQTAFPDGRRVTAPAKGKVATVKIKGTAVKHDGKAPVTLFHFQVLHPITGGKVKVSLTSGGFHVPVGGDPNRITTYHPVNLCVKRGDYVSFSDVGGYNHKHYPHGTPFRVFSSVVGSTTKRFTKSGIGNGSTFKGTARQGEELLMRMVLVTGKDAGVCK